MELLSKISILWTLLAGWENVQDRSQIYISMILIGKFSQYVSTAMLLFS